MTTGLFVLIVVLFFVFGLLFANLPGFDFWVTVWLHMLVGGILGAVIGAFVGGAMWGTIISACVFPPGRVAFDMAHDLIWLPIQYKLQGQTFPEPE